MKYVVLAIVLVSAIMVKANASDCGEVQEVISQGAKQGFDTYPHNAQMAEVLPQYLETLQTNFESETSFITSFREDQFQLMVKEGPGVAFYDFRLSQTDEGCVATQVWLPEHNAKASDMLLSVQSGSLVIEKNQRSVILVPKS